MHFLYNLSRSITFYIIIFCADSETMNPAVAEVVARGNPVIFFDISIGGVAAGRISCELFADVVPKTAGKKPHLILL